MPPDNGITVTQPLNRFENAPRLRDITALRDSTPTLSNSLPQRTTQREGLDITICGDFPYSIPPNRLFIPGGVPLNLGFTLGGTESPLPEDLAIISKTSSVPPLRRNNGVCAVILAE